MRLRNTSSKQEQPNLAKSGSGGDDGTKTSDTSSITQGSDKKSKDSDSGSGFASYATLLREKFGIDCGPPFTTS